MKNRDWYWPDFIKLGLIVLFMLVIALASREHGFTKTETGVAVVGAFAAGFFFGRISVIRRYDDS